MKTFTTESKSKKTQPSEQKYDTVRSNQASACVPAQSDVARRAYEIYLRNGRRPFDAAQGGQGQAEKNWYQAEQELRKEINNK